MAIDPGIKSSTIKKKNSDPLIAHKEKLKEDLSLLFLFCFCFSFLCFWLAEHFLVCFFWVELSTSSYEEGHTTGLV